MKKLVLLAVVLTAAAIVYACGASGGGTSLVTIDIGNDGGNAALAAEPATLTARIERALGSLEIGTGTALAAIPSNVQTVRLTVTGPGMTPVVKEVDAAGKTSVRIVVEVPNGAGRSFLVECFDASGSVVFKGSSVTDLDGAPVKIAIEMIDLTAYYVDVSTGTDTPSCGAYETPCKSITQALSLSPGNQPIYVKAGVYYDSSNGGAESFPIALKPGVTLKCLGPDYSTTISYSGSWSPTNPTSSGVQLVTGAAGATVENCRFQDGAPAIFDNGAAMTIKNNLFEGATVSLSAGSLVTGNQLGYGPAPSETAPAAISVQSGSPTISSNIVYFNTVAIEVTWGSPQITGNTVFYNSFGIEINGGSPQITGNNLTCSLVADFYNYTNGPVDATGNYWDHLPPDETNVVNSVADVANPNGGSVNTSGAILAANGCPVTLRLTGETGTDSGAVTVSPPGSTLPIDSRSAFQWPYHQDVTVSLEVMAGGTTTFSSWGGDCAGCGTNPSCKLTMDADKSCTVSFY